MMKTYHPKRTGINTSGRIAKTLLLALGLILNFSSYSQNKTPIVGGFEFAGNSPENAGFFKKSIEVANMEPYRLKKQRVKLHFENGFDIEMLSAEELYNTNKQILVGSYPESFPRNYLLPTFNVQASGYLVAIYPNTSKPYISK
ncbi:MAG: hypothetical protein ACXVC9_07640 [Bacteroidia bacterium]